MYPLTVERAGTSRLEMPIVKVDVHAPIFYFPKLKDVGCQNVSKISRTISIDIKS
jgi:hypothetical protein